MERTYASAKRSLNRFYSKGGLKQKQVVVKYRSHKRVPKYNRRLYTQLNLDKLF